MIININERKKLNTIMMQRKETRKRWSRKR